MVNFINSYFIVLGVLIGGVFIGGFGVYLVGEVLFMVIIKFVNWLKIWVFVVVIGGIFDVVYSFE